MRFTTQHLVKHAVLYYYYCCSLRLFHYQTTLVYFTQVWATANLLRSSGIFWVYQPILPILCQDVPNISSELKFHKSFLKAFRDLFKYNWYHRHVVHFYYYFTPLRFFHISIRCGFSTGVWATASLFHLSWTPLSILADLNNAIAWIVSTGSLFSNSSNPCGNHFATVSSVSITIGITFTFMFNSFFFSNSLARPKCLSFFSPYFSFTQWLAGLLLLSLLVLF